MRKILFTALGITITLLFIRVLSPNPCGESVHISLQPYDLCVPEENARYEMGFNPFSLITGFDSSGEGREALIFFSRLDYQTAAPGYEIERNVNDEPMLEDLVWVASLNDKEFQGYKYQGVGESNFEDLWFAEGDWEHRVLEPFGVNGWYRAFWFPNGDSWQVLRSLPDKQKGDHLQPDYWIASCRISFGQKTCSVPYLLEELRIVVGLDLDESNLIYRDEIGKFIGNKITSWKLEKDRT